MDNPTTYVLLIRHGENDWVGENRLAGRTPEVHLNETGRKQSARIVETLSDQELSAVYSSPMERCLETAQPVADAHGLAVTPESGVLEVDYGGWQGGSINELAKTPEWQLVQHAPSSFRFPDGETLFEVQVRAVDTVERIRQRHPNQVVAIFSHGDVIRTTVAHYLGIPIDLFQRVLISTGVHQRHRLPRCGRQSSLHESSIAASQVRVQAGRGAGEGARRNARRKRQPRWQANFTAYPMTRNNRMRGATHD